MNNKSKKRIFCVAPMMGYTTPYARRLYRMLSSEAFLFTEMIATKTMIHSQNRDLIIENNSNNPIALQVGGSEIDDLKKCSKIAKSYNYDEINLNVGCPSKAVQKGSFGACLMKKKSLVRNCLEQMKNAADIEVSVKCRIGIGKEFNYDFFSDFINEIIKSDILSSMFFCIDLFKNLAPFFVLVPLCTKKSKTFGVYLIKTFCSFNLSDNFSSSS